MNELSDHIDWYGKILRTGAAREIYRCPSLAPGVPGSSVGSNGRYEYVSPCVFSGANRDLMPPRSQDFSVPRRTVITPLIVEEDPAAYGNDGIFPEPAYSNVDRMGTWHAGRTSNYGPSTPASIRSAFERDWIPGSSSGEQLAPVVRSGTSAAILPQSRTVCGTVCEP